jgi:hypothetical protein
VSFAYVLVFGVHACVAIQHRIESLNQPDLLLLAFFCSTCNTLEDSPVAASSCIVMQGGGGEGNYDRGGHTSTQADCVALDSVQRSVLKFNKRHQRCVLKSVQRCVLKFNKRSFNRPDACQFV